MMNLYLPTAGKILEKYRVNNSLGLARHVPATWSGTDLPMGTESDLSMSTDVDLNLSFSLGIIAEMEMDVGRMDMEMWWPWPQLQTELQTARAVAWSGCMNLGLKHSRMMVPMVQWKADLWGRSPLKLAIANYRGKIKQTSRSVLFSHDLSWSTLIIQGRTALAAHIAPGWVKHTSDAQVHPCSKSITRLMWDREFRHRVPTASILSNAKAV